MTDKELNLEQICNRTRELAGTVGDFIRKESGRFHSGKIEKKGVHNFVTYVDRTSEEQLVSGLSEILPGCGFIAEEGTTERIIGEYTWVIDPLDGTTNFIHGLPPYSISIALLRGKQIILGVVYEITTGECFHAVEGGKAYLNGSEIRVSDTRRVEDSLLATGFPYSDFERFRPFMESLKYFMRNSHGVRRLGSASVDLAYLACGRFDAFWEYSLNPWDVAAGALIIERAGGCVGDFSGGTNYLFGKEIIATNRFLFKEFLGYIKKYMGDKQG